MLCMVGFTVAIFFLNFAYFFYEPFLGAWAVAVAGATKEEFENRQRAAEAVPVQPAFGPARFPQWAGPAPKPA